MIPNKITVFQLVITKKNSDSVADFESNMIYVIKLSELYLEISLLIIKTLGPY